MNTEINSPIPRRGLSALNEVHLDEHHRRILELARATSGGPAAWRQRKLAEVQDLLALVQISGRLKIEWLDLSVDLRAVVEMRVPVPCLRSPDAELEIAPRATLGIIYRQDVMVSPQPGYSFVQILSPGPVWHPNVSHDATQALCLGFTPRGVLLKEILVMTYGALTMTLATADTLAAMNQGANQWWSCENNLKRIPLSREPFLVNSETKL